MRAMARPPTPLLLPKGFTLVELTIVLVIVGLLIGGLSTALVVQQDNAAIRETRQNLATLNDALIGFSVANGRLPRPAASGTNGLEKASCASEADCTGFVPWQSLGINKTDSWNRLIRYSVTPAFASATPFTLTTAATKKLQSRDTAGTLIYLVGSAAACDATTNLCSPAVVFSSGKQNHAWLEDGTEITDSSVTNIDEETNANPLADANNNLTFISRTFSSGGTGGEFDDIVSWIPITVLYNRMIAAGKLP